MPKKKDPNKPRKKMGRPLKKIDYETLDNLCFIQCTGTEISSILGLHYDNLNKKLKKERGKSFTEYYAEKASGGKMSLRRRQFAMSKTNPTMAIWLGKNWLGQSDKTEIDHKNSDGSLAPTVIEIVAPDDES